MFNLFKCISIEGISIVEFLRQLKGKLEKHNYFLNPSMFWKFHSHFFSAYKELSTTTNILHSWFHWCWKVGFSSTILQKKKLRFQMVQDHRTATGGESIHVHLTLTPKVVPSPHAALGTFCMLHAYSQSALLQQVPARSKALARKGAFWGVKSKVNGKLLTREKVMAWGPGVEVSLRVVIHSLWSWASYLTTLNFLIWKIRTRVMTGKLFQAAKLFSSKMKL